MEENDYIVIMIERNSVTHIDKQVSNSSVKDQLLLLLKDITHVKSAVINTHSSTYYVNK